jgi:HK97 gp10 family phage protein
VNEVKGLAKLIDDLLKAGAEFQFQDTLKKEGQRVIDDAKALAPLESGDMRDSIGFITSKDTKFKNTVLIGLRKNYYNHYLGVMFEYGTEPRIQKTSGRYTGELTPKPFMRPALDKNRQAIVNGLKKGITEKVTKLAQKYNLK